MISPAPAGQSNTRESSNRCSPRRAPRASCADRVRRPSHVATNPGGLMQPLRIRIDRIVDFGTVVSLVGVDTETAMAVTIHVDHRPFASFWEAWRDAGLPQPIEYATDRLMLHLDMLPTADAETAQL